MNLLKDFWYGNIEPLDYIPVPCPESRELLRQISQNEEKFLATMTSTQKDLFSQYTDSVRQYQAMSECLLFQNSFRLGAKMMLEMIG